MFELRQLCYIYCSQRSRRKQNEWNSLTMKACLINVVSRSVPPRGSVSKDVLLDSSRTSVDPQTRCPACLCFKSCAQDTGFGQGSVHAAHKRVCCSPVTHVKNVFREYTKNPVLVLRIEAQGCNMWLFSLLINLWLISSIKVSVCRMQWHLLLLWKFLSRASVWFVREWLRRSHASLSNPAPISSDKHHTRVDTLIFSPPLTELKTLAPEYFCICLHSSISSFKSLNERRK